MKPHRFDPLSFSMGAVLLVFAVTYLVVGKGDVVSFERLWPATIILVGLTLAAWGLTVSVRRNRTEPEIGSLPPAEPAHDQPLSDAADE